MTLTNPSGIHMYTPKLFITIFKLKSLLIGVHIIHLENRFFTSNIQVQLRIYKKYVESYLRLLAVI